VTGSVDHLASMLVERVWWKEEERMSTTPIPLAVSTGVVVIVVVIAIVLVVLFVTLSMRGRQRRAAQERAETRRDVDQARERGESGEPQP
jgi:uncharacterized membrane protein